jgi:hypothetical protein
MPRGRLEIECFRLRESERASAAISVSIPVRDGRSERTGASNFVPLGLHPRAIRAPAVGHGHDHENENEKRPSEGGLRFPLLPFRDPIQCNLMNSNLGVH